MSSDYAIPSPHKTTNECRRIMQFLRLTNQPINVVVLCYSFTSQSNQPNHRIMLFLHLTRQPINVIVLCNSFASQNNQSMSSYHAIPSPHKTTNQCSRTMLFLHLTIQPTKSSHYAIPSPHKPTNQCHRIIQFLRLTNQPINVIVLYNSAA